MKQRFYYILATIAIVFCACDYGKDDVYNALPDINITQITETGVVPAQLFIGDTLRINPKVVYGNEGNAAFEFHWYKQSYSSLKLISQDSVLNYKVDSLGSLIIRLEVTNRKTGVSNSATAYTSVISQTQRGWYILKETAEGNTDIDVLGMSATGERTYTQSDILNGWGNPLTGKPVSLMFTYNYGWRAPGATYTSTYIQSIFAFSEKEGLTMGLTDQKIMTRGDDIYFDHKDAGNNNFSGAISTPLQMTLIDNGKAHIYQIGTQAFLPAVSGNYTLSPYFTSGAGSTNYQLGFDTQNSSFVYIKNLSGTLNYFPDMFNSKAPKISSNHMNGYIRFLENTDGSVNPDTASNVKRAYSLFIEKDRTDRAILLGLDLCQIDPLQYSIGNGKYSPVMYADTIYYSAVPSLQTATLFALHKNYPILYYSTGNVVYSYDILNKKASSLLSYNSSEQVSYIHYLPCIYDSYVFRQLIVATYNAADNSYKLYRYNINGNTPTQAGQAYTGKGKIKTLLFASPNSYSYYGGGSWNDEQYQYY